MSEISPRAGKEAIDDIGKTIWIVQGSTWVPWGICTITAVIQIFFSIKTAMSGLRLILGLLRSGLHLHLMETHYLGATARERGHAVLHPVGRKWIAVSQHKKNSPLRDINLRCRIPHVLASLPNTLMVKWKRYASLFLLLGRWRPQNWHLCWLRQRKTFYPDSHSNIVRAMNCEIPRDPNHLH